MAPQPSNPAAARVTTPSGLVLGIPEGSRLVFGRIGPTPNVNPQVGRQFVGQLDEVAIYNRALTAAEVQLHYRLIVPASAVKLA